MLTSKDINKIIEAEKEIFPTKEDFDDLRSDFRSLQTSVDNYSKDVKNLKDEVVVLNHRVGNKNK